MIINALMLGLSIGFGLLSLILMIQCAGYNERRGYVLCKLSRWVVAGFTAGIVISACASATFSVLFANGYGLPG